MRSNMCLNGVHLIRKQRATCLSDLLIIISKGLQCDGWFNVFMSSTESFWTNLLTDTEPVRLTCLPGQRTTASMPLEPTPPYTDQHSSIRGAIRVISSSVVLGKNTWSRTWKAGVSATDGQLGLASCAKLKSLKGQDVTDLIPPTLSERKVKQPPLSFLEESFSIFILKCNYRLLNGRRRPNCTHVIFH